jgi:hypothetical protein
LHGFKNIKTNKFVIPDQVPLLEEVISRGTMLTTGEEGNGQEWFLQRPGKLTSSTTDALIRMCRDCKDNDQVHWRSIVRYALMDRGSKKNEADKEAASKQEVNTDTPTEENKAEFAEQRGKVKSDMKGILDRTEEGIAMTKLLVTQLDTPNQDAWNDDGTGK